MQEGRFRFQTLEDARVLATHLARTCPEPERAVQGLQELMVNAVEHGNLGICYAEKGRYVLAGTWPKKSSAGWQRRNIPNASPRLISGAAGEN